MSSTILGTGEIAENKVERVLLLRSLHLNWESTNKQLGKERNKIILARNTFYKGNRTYGGVLHW